MRIVPEMTGFNDQRVEKPVVVFLLADNIERRFTRSVKDHDMFIREG